MNKMEFLAFFMLGACTVMLISILIEVVKKVR